MTGGADDFLAKPFRPGELADAVAAQLRKSYARMFAHRETGSHEEQVLRLAEEMHDLETRLVTAYAERQRTQRELTLLNSAIDHRVARETDMLERQNSALKAYGHAIAHELRRPLRGILGFAGLLVDGHAATLPPECADLLSRIEASGQRMNAFIEGLLAMAESERAELRRETVDLSTMVADIIAADGAIGVAGRSDVRIAPGLSAQSDPVLARIVLENLLSNALKYSAKGTHPLIEFDACELNGEQVYFVRDNGAGFDMAWAEKLFQPFQRLHSSTEYEGLGIGLATVERIIARHQGRIWAKGEPGEGATFFFTLAAPP
jgi:signal transduction histidine kinase